MKPGLVSIFHRTGLFCAGLLPSFAVVASMSESLIEPTWLLGAILMLYTVPGFFAGSWLGRVRSVRVSWTGGVLAVIGGVLCPPIVLCVLPNFVILWVGYGFAVGLAASMPGAPSECSSGEDA